MWINKQVIQSLDLNIFTLVEDTKSMDGWYLASYKILEIVAIRGQKSMVTYVIKVTEFNSEVGSDLPQVVWRPPWPRRPPTWLLEAIFTWIPRYSWSHWVQFWGQMWPLRLYGGRHMASEKINMAVRGNMHMDTRVIKVDSFKSEVKLGFWGHQNLNLNFT